MGFLLFLMHRYKKNKKKHLKNYFNIKNSAVKADECAYPLSILGGGSYQLFHLN
jgi:hypothetical protein